VSEIKQVARRDPVEAAEGAVAFLERISPALENVDSSSGAIGTAVNHAIADLVPIIAGASVDATTKAAWFERLFDAHGADRIPYIETLADYWGELCGSAELASAWANRLIGVTRLALSPDKNVRGHFHGTIACLSALLAARRYDEILALVDGETLWPYREWAVRALVAQGRHEEAIQYADHCRNAWANDTAIDAECERILLAAGRPEEAYARYALTANRAMTHTAWFRAIAKKYPHKPASTILTDLVRLTPGEEGKWFAAAKDAKLFDEAIALAKASPCDPRTLTRAARDFAEKNPLFATDAGLTALQWLVQGHGYEITTADVWAACAHTLHAARHAGRGEEVRARIQLLVGAAQRTNDMVVETIERCLRHEPE